jgi:hypothetical protein
MNPASFQSALLMLLSTGITAFFLMASIDKERKRLRTIVLASIVIWLSLEALLAMNDFFTDFEMPPRLLIAGVGPMILLIIVLSKNKKSSPELKLLNLRMLTWLHVVRIPVEIMLYKLCAEKLVSPLMTFEGWNYDILSGISAIAVATIAFRNGTINKPLLITWNLICMALLGCIVAIAILTAPFPFQVWSLEQPNLAVFEFPFIWLPVFIVPSVLFAHVVSLKQLLSKNT